MIHLSDILDAILSDGGPLVSIVFAPCEDCGVYHVVSHENHEELCDLCRPEMYRIAKLKEKKALKVDKDGGIRQ